jgi:hypothetical protein
LIAEREVALFAYDFGGLCSVLQLCLDADKERILRLRQAQDGNKATEPEKPSEPDPESSPSAAS